MTKEQQLYVEKNLKWNFSVNVIDITFITLGISLVSRETIMPLFVSTLTDSALVIGFIPAIYNLGYYVPQLLAANLAESLKRKKPFVTWVVGIGERLPYLFIGLAILLLAEQSPDAMLVAFFALVAATAISNGVGTPAWFTMIGKVLPVNRRGIFFGISGGLGALMGIIGAYFVGQILEQVAYPENFARLFLIAFGFMVISWLGLALNREPESPVVKKQIPLIRYLKQLPAVLRRDANYRRYLLSYSISRLGAMGIGFFVVFGNKNFDLSGTEVGLLTALLIGSQAFTQLFWGWIGDHIGHKIVLVASASALALAGMIAATATSLSMLMLAMVCLGTAVASDNIAKFNIVLEFAVPEDQPTYIGLTNTLLAPVTGLGPILGGALATGFGYRPMFVIAMSFAIIGGLMLLLWVREPRHITPQPTVTTA